MDEDNRAQETPGSSLSVNMEHTQDLQEANAAGKQQWCLNAVYSHQIHVGICSTHTHTHTQMSEGVSQTT